MSISLVINTLNEEKNIKACINSARYLVDEVIVCDMHSNDRTVEIAKSMNAKVCVFDRSTFVEPARHFAISHVSSEWVLVLDADERMTDKLSDQLKTLSGNNQVSVVSFASLFNYFGGHVKHGLFFTNNWTRFFRKKIYLDTYTEKENTIHYNFYNLSQVKQGRVILSKDFYIIHEAYPTIEKYVNKTVDHYARVEARQKFDQGIHFSFFRMIFEPLKVFLSNYIFKGGFWDGVRGLVLNVFFAVFRFNVWANLWFLEQEKQKSLEHK